MSFPLLWTVIAASSSAMIAALALGFATAGLFSVTNLSTLVALSDDYVVLAGRLAGMTMGVHVAMWRAYVAAQLRQPMGRVDRWLVGGTLAVAGVSLIPGLVVGGEVGHHEVAWVGARYNDALITPFGNLVILIYFSLTLEVMVRYARRWRGGDGEAGLHAVGLSAMLVTGASDAVVGNNLLSAPYLLDLGFMTVVVVVAIALIRRFVSNTRALHDLRRHLEREVAARTAELTEAQVSLMRAEKLASVGQLAAGVAHEINNPIAVIIANAGYLKDEYAESKVWPPDTEACIDDAATSAKRVAAIIRQLLDAGRIASKAGTSTSFSVEAATTAAVAQVRAGASIEVSIDCPADLQAIGEAGPIERVLVSLLANAIYAIGERAGRIAIRATADGHQVRIRVIDDGSGMSDLVAKRAFEPFFTTKDVGAGTGLGLAAALGIVRSMGGDLRLESSTPEGTSMMITLDRSPATPGP